MAKKANLSLRTLGRWDVGTLGRWDVGTLGELFVKHKDTVFKVKNKY